MPKPTKPTPRRRTVRIGSGDFRDPGRPVPQVQAAFVAAVARLVPDALRELEVLADNGPRRDDWADLRQWAERWGWLDPWLLRHAQRTLRHWRAHPETRGRFAPFMAGEWFPDPLPFPNPVWDTRLETEAAFDARVAAYKAQVRGAEYARGAEPVPTKRVRAHETVDRHVEWLVLHQVGGLTLDAIAGRYTGDDRDALLTPAAVSLGIQGAARLAGVRVRRH